MSVDPSELSAKIEAAVNKALLEASAEEKELRLQARIAPRPVSSGKPNPVPPGRFPWWPILGLFFKSENGQNTSEGVQAKPQ